MKKRYSLSLIAVASLILILAIVRAALPWWIEETINQRLADLGDYEGQVSDVNLKLWRGAYELMDLEIVNKSGSVPLPFFSVDIIDLAISWEALWHGAVVAEVTFNQPILSFVDTREDTDQTGAGTDWREALQRIVPIRINQLLIREGSLQFRNFDSNPPVDVRVVDIEGVIKDLNNINRSSGSQPAVMSIEGSVLGQASASLSGQLDPLGDFRNFRFALKVTDIDLRRLNDVAQAYGNFDFQGGSADFLMELEANEGQLQGYAKPLLSNVDIVDFEKDIDQGVLSATWEAFMGAMGWIFRNHEKDRIASRIEIRGNLDDSEVSAWQAFLSILHNAFVEAYEARFGDDT